MVTLAQQQLSYIVSPETRSQPRWRGRSNNSRQPTQPISFTEGSRLFSWISLCRVFYYFHFFEFDSMKNVWFDSFVQAVK